MLSAWGVVGKVGWNEHCWQEETCWCVRCFQASAEHNNSSASLVLTAMESAPGLPAVMLPAWPWGYSTRWRGSTCKCLAQMYFHPCKLKSPLCAVNKPGFEGFLKPFLHTAVWFSLKSVSFFQRGSRCLERICVCSWGNCRTIVLAQPHFAWVKAPLSVAHPSRAQPVRWGLLLLLPGTTQDAHWGAPSCPSLQCEGQQAGITFSDKKVKIKGKFLRWRNGRKQVSLSVRGRVPLRPLQTFTTKPRCERQAREEEQKTAPSVSLSCSVPVDLFYHFFPAWVKVATGLRSLWAGFTG